MPYPLCWGRGLAGRAGLSSGTLWQPQRQAVSQQPHDEGPVFAGVSAESVRSAMAWSKVVLAHEMASSGPLVISWWETEMSGPGPGGGAGGAAPG